MKKWLYFPAAVAAAVMCLISVSVAQDGPATGGQKKGRARKPDRGPAGPVPRLSDGKPDFTGIWNGFQQVNEKGELIAGGAGESSDAPPMLPWAQKVTAERVANKESDDFEARCLPGTPPRAYPYHMELVSTPKLVLMLFEGNTHMFRQFFVDGSDHPKNLKPTFYGDSRGHWEGDTLVVDTIGVNDYAWMDRIHPHSKQYHLIEKFHRDDYGNLAIDTTIDDPGTFTKPWHMLRVVSLETAIEITEYVCNENNLDPAIMNKTAPGSVAKFPSGVPPVPAAKAPAPPSGSAPRTPEGKTDFSGVWVVSGKTVLPSEPSYKAEFQAIYDQRRAAKGKGDPESLCLPDGAVRVTDLPYKIVQTPKMIVRLSEGNVHSYRRFFLDGRTQQAALDVEPQTRSGISVGKWDGDALVVDTIGFDDKTWLDSTGKPHSDAMHLTERYTRPDLGHLNAQITIDDSKALNKPYTFNREFTLAPSWELQEYICQAVLDALEPAPKTPLN